MIRAILNSELPATEEWVAELSPDRYRTMLRLLHEDDWRFLREQRGFRPEMEKVLRRQRVQIFQTYLRALESDFRRLCDGLRQQGAPAIVQRQLAFVGRMMLVRAKLAMYRMGVGRVVDARGLVQLFDETRAQLTATAPELVELPA
ncbi:MAG: hypothetical protein JWP63_4413 [Candidatus Solibacter sp.]|nr:hypothetical protein [Candidatus Solibacter sp.]